MTQAPTQADIEAAEAIAENIIGFIDGFFDWEGGELDPKVADGLSRNIHFKCRTIAQALAAAREEGRQAEWGRVLSALKSCEKVAEKAALKHKEAGRESAYQRFAGHADFCTFGHIHLAPLEERQKIADSLNKFREGNLPTNAPDQKGQNDE